MSRTFVQFQGEYIRFRVQQIGRGNFCGGPHRKGNNISGSILGSFSFGKLPCVLLHATSNLPGVAKIHMLQRHRAFA